MNEAFRDIELHDCRVVFVDPRSTVLLYLLYLPKVFPYAPIRTSSFALPSRALAVYYTIHASTRANTYEIVSSGLTKLRRGQLLSPFPSVIVSFGTMISRLPISIHSDILLPTSVCPFRNYEYKPRITTVITSPHLFSTSHWRLHCSCDTVALHTWL